MEFKVGLDESTLEMSKSGAIWGAVWVEVGDLIFPERLWNDLPVAFCIQLMQAAAAADSVATEVAFFDGPMALKVSINGDQATILLDGKGVCEGGSFLIPSSNFSETVTVASSSLLENCERRGWKENLDVKRLREVTPRKT